MRMYFVIVGKRKRVYGSWEITKQHIQFSQCFFILELQLKVINILKHRQVVCSIYEKHSWLHPLHWKSDMLADGYFNWLLFLII